MERSIRWRRTAACGDDPTGKVQFANQGQKFSLETFVASRPGLEFRYELAEFVIRERSFHGVGGDQDTQKHQACGGFFNLFGGKGYAHLRDHVENGLDIVAQADEWAGPTVQ